MKPIFWVVREQWFVLHEAGKFPTTLVLGTESYRVLLKEMPAVLEYYTSLGEPVLQGLKVIRRESIEDLVVVY